MRAIRRRYSGGGMGRVIMPQENKTLSQFRNGRFWNIFIDPFFNPSDCGVFGLLLELKPGAKFRRQR